jgi:hypothetical protein
MRKHAAVFGVLLVVLLLLVGAAALAQEASAQPTSAGVGWTEVGAILGTVLASAAASGASVLGVHRFGRPSSGLSDDTTALLARLDERTEAIQGTQETHGRRLDSVAKKQHRHGNALLVLLLREGHSPEEQTALTALQDDSDDDPSPPKVAP